LFLIGVIGCKPMSDVYNDAASFTVSSFPETKELSGEILPIEILTNPRQIVIKDSLLLVVGTGSDFFVSVYNIGHGSFEGEFLSKGRGPNDALGVRYLSFFNDDRYFLLNDHLANKVFVYDSDKLDHPNHIQPDYVISLDESLDDILFFSENTFLGKSDVMTNEKYANSRIKIFGYDGNVLKTFGDYPASEQVIIDQALNFAFDFRPVLEPAGNRIALFYKLTDLIELYDRDGQLIKRAHGPDQFFPAVTVKERFGREQAAGIPEETRQAYFGPLAVEDQIWVKYSGNLSRDYDTFFHLMVFNWDLNPMGHYVVPHSILAFDVNTQKRIIYTLSVIDDDYRIIAYSL